jgi:ParB family chromosome partitioning protein
MTTRTGPARGLGRGLGALIPTGASVMEELPTAAIVPNPRQPRQSFDDDAISDLAASIRQVGILQPVVVRPAGDGSYQLVVGERRWRAARRAGLAQVPALVIETDEQGALERALVENVHRQDLNAVEEAAAYQQLIDEAGLTHEELAERLGLSRPAISNSLRLLDLPPSVQRLLVDGRLTAGHGRALLGLAGHPLLERVAQRVAAEQLSVRKTEEVVRGYRLNLAPDAPSVPRARPASLDGMGEALSAALHTRVRVTMGKRKGHVVIECGSKDDLQRVCELLLAHQPQPEVEPAVTEDVFSQGL